MIAPPVLDLRALRHRLDVLCCECGHPFQIAPSLRMTGLGENSGAGSCPRCRVYLHFTATSDCTATSEPWAAYLAREVTELEGATWT